MSQVIEFTIKPTKNSLHKDFIMQIPSINVKEEFDTYYFWDGKFKTDSYEHLTKLISDYIRKCKNTILNLRKNQFAYIPVDFSDQYYGVFKATLLDDGNYELMYGSVDKAINTTFHEDEKSIYFDIGNSSFEDELSIQLSKDDLVDSFVLSF